MGREYVDGSGKPVIICEHEYEPVRNQSKKQFKYCVKCGEAKETVPTEASWCIELVGANLYWTGAKYEGKYNGVDAWGSINSAVRFARKIDAELTMVMQGIPRNECSATEHIWQ